jgi:protein involved in polysaccharide export with SLBB domain
MRLLLLILSLSLLSPPAHAQTAGNAAEATLRPGDLIRIAVWREEDLSGDFPVDENGVVVLPMLGSTQVAGIAVGQIRELLLAEYRQQLRNPSIQITPLRRVMVLGEVMQPGLQELDPTISLAGAIALAGGPNPSGTLDRIRVVRDGQVLTERVSPAASLNTIDIRSGDQIFVGRRSWIATNSLSVVATGVSLLLLMLQLF